MAGAAECTVLTSVSNISACPVSSIRNLARACGRDGSTGCRTKQKATNGDIGDGRRSATHAVDGDLTTSSLAAPHDAEWNPLLGDTDPWWRVELFASSSVFNVSLTLPGSETLGVNNRRVVTHPISIYIGESPDFVNNFRCASNVNRPDNSMTVQILVPCEGVGRYLHIVMPGPDEILRLTEVEVMGCHLEVPPSASVFPAGYSRWNHETGTCLPCPVGWTTDSNVAGPDMWQRCNVPCSEAMMNDASTGCKGAWYKVTGSSCRQKCAAVGLDCKRESIYFTTTFDRAKSVFDLMGETSTCSSAKPRPISTAFAWIGWGPGQVVSVYFKGSERARNWACRCERSSIDLNFEAISPLKCAR